MARILPVLLAVSTVGVVGYLAVDRMGWFEGASEAAVEGAPVRSGPLRISVLESGNLESANSQELKSEVEGQTTILYLIDEGAEVEPGELLVELDATNLIERRVTQEISVESARSAKVKASQNLEIQKSQNESDLAAAKRAVDFAKKDLEKYVEGDWPQQKQAADDAILLAKEELKRASDTLTWSKELHANGFVTRTELEADQLAHQRAEIKQAQEQRARELLEEYDYPRQEAELLANVDEAQRELRRVELQAEARLVDFEADVRSTTARYELEAEKLVKLEDQIGKTKIYAPIAGMVVYAKQGNSRWGNDDPIEEGTSVRERQALVTIPSSEGIKIEASIHESVLEKVQVGQPVIVKVDALPDRMFAGEVLYKAPLPDQNSWWANPDLRVYRTDIGVLDPDIAMRPGMTCSIEVVVADLEDATYIPVQSVFLDKGEPVAFVQTGKSWELRRIELGLSNEAWVSIEAGVSEGEIVALSQPPGFRLEPAMSEEPAIDFGGGASGGDPGSGGRPKDAGARTVSDSYGSSGGGGGGGARPSKGGKPSGAGAPSAANR